MVGEVELLHKMGDDLMVVNAARVSFDKQSSSIGPGDAKLIKYLATHGHISPFFHPTVQFRLKMPIFVAREWFRHTVGFARNEVSRRYVDSEPELWTPDELRTRPPNVKQGSSDERILDEALWLDTIERHNEECSSLYMRLREAGVCPEQARTVLPQGMMTEFIETGSLAAYARLCRLRLDPTAQKEIRLIAEKVAACMAKEFPLSWAALLP